MSKTAKAQVAEVKASKNGKNGHIKQLNAEQRLALRDIHNRILEYRVQTEQAINQARGFKDQAEAASLEFQNVAAMHAKRLGIDLATHDFDVKKLQFKTKALPA
jgi:hypothetical protein